MYDLAAAAAAAAAAGIRIFCCCTNCKHIFVLFLSKALFWNDIIIVNLSDSGGLYDEHMSALYSASHMSSNVPIIFVRKFEDVYYMVTQSSNSFHRR